MGVVGEIASGRSQAQVERGVLGLNRLRRIPRNLESNNKRFGHISTVWTRFVRTLESEPSSDGEWRSSARVARRGCVTGNGWLTHSRRCSPRWSRPTISRSSRRRDSVPGRFGAAWRGTVLGLSLAQHDEVAEEPRDEREKQPDDGSNKGSDRWHVLIGGCQSRMRLTMIWRDIKLGEHRSIGSS